jgi:hypothetical protein
MFGSSSSHSSHPRLNSSVPRPDSFMAFMSSLLISFPPRLDSSRPSFSVGAPRMIFSSLNDVIYFEPEITSSVAPFIYSIAHLIFSFQFFFGSLSFIQTQLIHSLSHHARRYDLASFAALLTMGCSNSSVCPAFLFR